MTLTPPGPRQLFPGQTVLSLRLRTLDFLTEITKRYGDVVSFPVGSLRYFIVSDPELIRDVLVTHDEKFTKGPALRRAKVTLGEGLLTSEGDFHRRQRRLAQPAFHPHRVASYGEIFTRYAQRMSGTWRDGEMIDAHEAMMQLTLEIVAKTLFDAEVQAQVRELGEAMTTSVNMFTRALAPWGPILNRLPLPSNFRFRKQWNRLLATVVGFIAERRASGVDRGDLLSMLLRATDSEGDGGGMSEQQLRDECITLFTAGHETTANALTFTWYLLAQHPRVEAKLHEELSFVLAGRAPATNDIDKLPYTRAVLAESMRLYPPAWAVGRQAKGDITLGGYHVPAGSVVLMSQWVVHRLEKWWPNAESFDPDRWLTPDPARPRYAYFPFGGGSRSCIGESFAWMEATMVIATLAQRWKLSLTNNRPLKLLPTITLRPKGAMPMRLALQ